MTGNVPEILRIAETHRAMGDFAGAVRMLERAAGLDPANPEIHARLGICQNRLNRFAALKPLRRALELDPTHLAANRELGVILTSLGDHAGAATCFDAVVRARPEDTMALTMLGKARCRLGQSDDGIACLHRAMTLSGDSFEPHYQLSMLKRFEPDDPDTALLRDLFTKAEGKAPPDQEANLALALAKANEDCGDFGAAADLYLHGKQLLRRATPYSLDAARRLVDRVKAVFDRETLAAVRDRGLSGFSPVFVVGLPRSGKTSVAQLIGRHPRTVVEPEVVGLGDVVFDLIPSGEAPFDAQSVRDKLVRSAAARRPAPGPGATAPPVKVSHSPGNLWALGLIDMLFGDAKVIHCTREPLPHCVALFKYRFTGAPWGFANSFEDTIEYLTVHTDLMGFWQSVIRTPVHPISLDSLAAQGTSGLRDLYSICGLDPATSREPPHEFSVGTAWDDGIAGAPVGHTAAEAERRMIEAFVERVPALRALASRQGQD